MIKKIGMVLVAASMFAATATPASAIPSSQRVSVLKYYQCLAQKVIYPYLLCHL